MIGCLLYALVALVIAIICVVIIEWGITLLGVSLPPQLMVLIRLLVAILWLIYVIGCLGATGFGSFSLYPGHMHPSMFITK